MWYDLLVLAILGYFALRGAAKGLLNQLASIAAIVVCLVFAESFSAVFGPMIHLPPPLPNWVAMFGAYLVCSFIAFGLARVLDDWLERAKLDSFNQHLGFIFGLAKGGLLCLVMTFFLVTLSPAARNALSNSKSAYVAARIMDKVHPIMPEKLQEALAKYLHVSATGLPETPAADPAQNPAAGWPGGAPAQAGTNPPIQWNPNAPFPAPGPTPGAASPFPNSTGTPTQLPLIDTQAAVNLFVSQLPTTVNGDLRNRVSEYLSAVPPQYQQRAQQDVWNWLTQSRPEDLREVQTQLANNRQSLGDALAKWMGGFVQPRPAAPATPTYSQPSYPTTNYTQPTAPSYAQPSTSNYGQPSSAPNYSAPTYTQPQYTPPAYQPSTAPNYLTTQPGGGGYQPGGTYTPSTNGYQQPTAPNYSQPTPSYTPPPMMAQPQSEQDQLLAEISRAFSSIQPVQLQVQDDIRRRLAGLPPEVSLGVLADWRRDLWQPQARDPDPTTDSGTTLEQRILSQLQTRRIPVNQLSLDVQSRLEGATLR
jgi:uncharacterized membrane protein required for colicin V production